MNRRKFFNGMVASAIIPFVPKPKIQTQLSPLVEPHPEKLNHMDWADFTEVYRGIEMEFTRYRDAEGFSWVYRVWARFPSIGKPRTTYALGWRQTEEQRLDGDPIRIDLLRHAMKRTIDHQTAGHNDINVLAEHWKDERPAYCAPIKPEPAMFING